MKIAIILFAQWLVYLTCINFFELYILVVIFSILGLGAIQKSQLEKAQKRLHELAMVETFYVTLLYVLFFVGYNQMVAYMILILILLPQGILFMKASYNGTRYVKVFNTAIHLLCLIFLSIQSTTAAINYLNYPQIFDASTNDYYGILYLIWGLPFLVSGEKYHSIGFLVLQSFSLLLSFCHEDFLSMRLFTAQISFILIFMLKVDFQLETTQYLKKTNSTLSVLSSIGIFLLIASCFFIDN